MILLKSCQPIVLQLCKHQNVFKSSISVHNVVFCSTKVKSNSEEVYYGTLTPQIKGVKIFSISTSAAGVVAQPILYQQVAAYGGSLPLTIALATFVGFFTFVTPFLLHYVTKKYVTHIRYSKEDCTYTASLLTFFVRPRQVVFRPKDVTIPDILGPFTSFSIKGEPVFVDSRSFKDPEHYIKIMGYDKPIDFKLGSGDESIENKSNK